MKYIRIHRMRNNNYEYNFKNKSTNKLLFDTWIEYARKIKDYYIINNNDGKYNFVNENGKFAFKTWLSGTKELGFGIFSVYRNDNKCNIFNNGEILLDKWVDQVSLFCGKHAFILADELVYALDKMGNIKYCIRSEYPNYLLKYEIHDSL